MLLTAAAIVGCARGEYNGPTEPDDDMVALELTVEGSVQITTRTDINDVRNAAVIVFNHDGSQVLQCKYIEYADGERVFLKKNATYQIFVVANFTNANCPPGYTVKTYLKDVERPGDLENKYLFFDSPTPDWMIMYSELTTVPVAATLLDPADRTVTIKMFRAQSKIELNVYNKISGKGGDVTSNVTLYSYYTKGLPKDSHLTEQGSDIGQAGYERTDEIKFEDLAAPVDVQNPDNGKWYRKYTTEIISFENRKGKVPAVDNPYKRKEFAPENALEITIVAFDAVEGTMFNTYVHPGNGRSVEPNDPDIDDITDFNVDRNCIYHVNVYIDGVSNIRNDSRREHLTKAVCGDLESPGDGGVKEW